MSGIVLAEQQQHHALGVLGIEREVVGAVGLDPRGPHRKDRTLRPGQELRRRMILTAWCLPMQLDEGGFPGHDDRRTEPAPARNSVVSGGVDRGLERPERSRGRGVDRLAGVGIVAELELHGA